MGQELDVKRLKLSNVVIDWLEFVDLGLGLTYLPCESIDLVFLVLSLLLALNVCFRSPHVMKLFIDCFEIELALFLYLGLLLQGMRELDLVVFHRYQVLFEPS